MAMESVSEVFKAMPEKFDPAAAQGFDMVFQFHITGEQAGDWNVTIQDGTCTVAEGVHDSPGCTMTMADQDWLAMVSGQLNGAAAFMSGKLKIEGDIMAAQRLGSLFKLG